jgi:hypothetical protein
MRHSFDDLVALNQVAAERFAYCCLLEFRFLAGREGPVKFGWSNGGQFGWCVVRPASALTTAQRRALHARGWKYGRYRTEATYGGGVYEGWRGWSKRNADFDPSVVATEAEAANYFEARREEAAFAEC